jgi:hypothetical protein
MNKIVRMVEIDENELAVRLAIVLIGKSPPANLSAEDAIEELEELWKAERLGPFPFRRLALAASDYFFDAFNRAGTLQ